MSSSVLLELDDDSNELSYAFLLWSSLVAILWYASRRVESRDAAARIAAEARPEVEVVRQARAIERQREVERQWEQHHQQQQPPSSSSSSQPSSSQAQSQAEAQPSPFVLPTPPADREDCPVCLDTVKWPIDTNCLHTYCCECFMQYHQQSGGVFQDKVKCPCCRRSVDAILMSRVGWSDDERQSSRGEELIAKMDAYNRRFSTEPRPFIEVVRDTPNYLTRLWSELTHGGDDGWRIIRNIRLWIMIIVGLSYLISPLNFLSQRVFGFIGLLDDVALMMVLLGGVASMFRGVATQQHNVHRHHQQQRY